MRTIRLRHDETGIALIMALGIMFTLSITLASVLALSSSSSRSSSHSRASQEAFSLAEAGINNGMAVLAKAAEDDVATPVTNPSLLPERTTAYDLGSATWSGAYAPNAFGTGGIWTLTATGVRDNPTGPEAPDVTRTVSVKVRVIPEDTQPLTQGSWNYVYLTSDSDGCDLHLKNTMRLGTRLYLPGNLCLDNSSTVTSGPLLVGGWTHLQRDNTSIGSVAAPISEARIAGGCKSFRNPVLHTPCLYGGAPLGDNVYAPPVAGSIPPAIRTDFPSIEPPVANFAAMYQQASPGPRYPCTSTSADPGVTLPVFESAGNTAPDGSVTTVFNLAPKNGSYTCKTAEGELSWNNATKKLTVRGTVYIDGSAVIDGAGHSPSTFDYDGQGALYLGGTMRFWTEAKLCGARSGNACDRSGWNPNADLLVIAANGDGGQVPIGDSILMAQTTMFQGAFFATNRIELRNDSEMQGPMVGITLVNGQSARTTSFPDITTVPWGMPGNTPSKWNVAPPTEFRG